MAQGAMRYISITGLELRSVRHAPAFWWHALCAMRQVRTAPGLMRVEARQINRVHHTLTVWESEAAMRAYLVQGAHLAAMKAFGRIATGRTFGFQAEAPPGWDEVHAIWRSRGRVVGSR